MFIIKIMIFLFVAGSFNVISLLLAHTLPALDGIHQEAVAVTVGFLLIANAIFLYLLFFKLSVLSKADRYKKFEELLKKGSDELTEKDFEKALKKWKDSR